MEKNVLGYDLEKLRNTRKILIRNISNPAETNVTDEKVTHLLRVSQVLCSNLGQGYGYSGIFSCYYSVSDVNVVV
jgi:hypothetical protein